MTTIQLHRPTQQELRLAMIKQTTRLLRLGFWGLEKKFGKVLMPYTRSVCATSGLGLPRAPLLWGAQSLSVPSGVRVLVELRASRRNRCAFCEGAHHAVALLDGHANPRLVASDNYDSSRHFEPAERAALAMVDDIANRDRISTAAFCRLSSHFSELQIAELVWLTMPLLAT